MKTYIGTKIIQAEPMAAINGDEGYRVVYQDGYTSWSPKAAFEDAYRRTSGMPFGLAIEALRKGYRVARAGWNGNGMWLSIVWAAQWQVATEVPGMADPSLLTVPWIGMKTADNKFVPWLASQTDMLSDDWQVVGELESFAVAKG